MTGFEYEKFCAKELKRKGFYDIKVTRKSGDQGVDIIASKLGSRYAIQCKCYSYPIGNKAVQQVYAGARYYHCEKALVISNSTFTKSAKELADATGVILWENIGREYVAAKNILPSMAKVFYSSFAKLLILLGVLDAGICFVNFGYDVNSFLILLRGVLALIAGILGTLDDESWGMATVSTSLFLTAFFLNHFVVKDVQFSFRLIYYFFGLASPVCLGYACKPKKKY